METEKESIRVDSRIKQMVSTHIESTKQSIGGFYDIAAEKLLFEEWCNKQSPEYLFEWGSVGMDKNSLPVVNKQYFSRMTDAEKKTAFSLNLKPIIN